MLGDNSCTYVRSLSLAKYYYRILSYLYRKYGVTHHRKPEKEHRIRKWYQKVLIIRTSKGNLDKSFSGIRI